MSSRYPASQLPATGVGDELEILLSSIFIADKTLPGFATRSCTVIIVDKEKYCLSPVPVLVAVFQCLQRLSKSTGCHCLGPYRSVLATPPFTDAAHLPHVIAAWQSPGTHVGYICSCFICIRIYHYHKEFVAEQKQQRKNVDAVSDGRLPGNLTSRRNAPGWMTKRVPNLCPSFSLNLSHSRLHLCRSCHTLCRAAALCQYV